MTSWIKRLVFPVAAIAMFAMVSSARADTVTYSTSGGFTAAGSDSVDIFGVLHNAVGNMDLSFAGTAATTSDPLTATFQTLGNFTMHTNVPSSGSPASFNSGDTFTLTLTQLLPPGLSSQTSTATITGSVQFVSSPVPNSNSGTVILHFTQNPVYITALNGLTYSYLLHDVNMNFTSGRPSLVGGTLSADISVVPLPATAGTGLAMILCLGGLRIVRSRRSQDSAA